MITSHTIESWQGLVERYNARCEEAKTDVDINFVLKNWVLISQEEALQRNPLLQRWLDKLQKEGIQHPFFICKQLINDRCAAYDERPYICSGFPFYNHQPLTLLRRNFLLYSDDCGFKCLRIISPTDTKEQYCSDCIDMRISKLSQPNESL